MKNLKKYRMWFAPFVLLILLIILYQSIDNFTAIKNVVFRVLGVMKPFFVGFGIAYILNMPCKKINAKLSKSKYKFFREKSKGISILTVYLITLIIIVISVQALVPAIYKNCLDLYENAPVYISKIAEYVDDLQAKMNINIFSVSDNFSIEKALEEFIKSIDLTEFSKYAQGVINLTSGVINTVIAIIVSVYMLIDAGLIKNTIKKIMSVFISEKKVNSVCAYFHKINDIFSKYIYCRVIDAVIITILSTLILYILRVKYALVLGIMIGLLNLIPYFGSIMSTIIAMLISLVTGGIFKMIWVGVALLILQQFDGNYLGPKIMGDILEIRPLWVIFAVTVGGGLFGVLGMLISVPILVVIKMMFEEFIESKKIKNSIKAEENEKIPKTEDTKENNE